MMKWMRWAATLLLSVSCVRAHLVPCGDVACPVGDVCTPGGCADPEAAAACDGIADGEMCTTSSIADGTCAGGSCHPVGCGNGIVDHGEACDDGNQTPGDGCSADCRSTEVCGNGVVDALPHGEQCDDGFLGVSGDGCSSRCELELAVW